MKDFSRTVAATVAANVLRVPLRFALSILVAHSVGVEGQGLFSLALVLSSLLAIFADLGWSPVGTYQVAQGRYPLAQIVGNTLALGLISAALALLVGAAAVVLLGDSYFASFTLDQLWLALALVPPTIFLTQLQSILLGRQEFGFVNLSGTAMDVLALGLTFAGVVLLGGGVMAALAANVLAVSVSGALVLRRIRQLSGPLRIELNPAYLRDALAYGAQAHLAALLGKLVSRIDMLLINGLLGVAAVGLYSVATGLVEKLWLISQAAATVLFPKVAGSTDEAWRKDLTPRIVRIVLCLTTLQAVTLYILSEPLVALFYSSAFLPAARLVQILLPGIVALSASRVLASDISGRGRQDLGILVVLSTLAGNVVLNLILIPRFQIEGAAWACTASYVMNLVSRLLLYCKLSGNSVLAVFVPAWPRWQLYRRMLR